MGQARNVLVYHLLCDDTIDERLTGLLARKQAEFDAFADKSVSAEAAARKDVEIDDKSFGKLVQEEIDRINEKNGSVAVEPMLNPELISRQNKEAGAEPFDEKQVVRRKSKIEGVEMDAFIDSRPKIKIRTAAGRILDVGCDYVLRPRERIYEGGVKAKTIKKEPPAGFDILKEFSGAGIEYIDKRAEGGRLWLIDERCELEAFVRQYKEYGFEFVFTRLSKTAGFRPAWYLSTPQKK